jgi:G6PDH family F420-dependent oxidoreductase
MEIGYKLSSEEFAGTDLVEHAQRAEACGFTFALISDHFHPWTDRQGQSPFVWAVLGGIAAATRTLRVGTGVTCPILRIHPAIVAQAAATVAAMLPGRFFLGLGAGENVNEHVLAQRWPSVDVRHSMLDEAITVIRDLWDGGLVDHRGLHYTVENARLYTRPAAPPPIMVAASGPRAAALAASAGEGLICSDPSAETVKAYREAGGQGPRFCEITVCWATDEQQARRTAREIWPIAGFSGPLTAELPLPSHFEKAAAMLTEDRIAEAVVCGPDPERHLRAIQEAVEAGFDHVCVHQVGPDQAGFFQFYEREVIPRLRREDRVARRAA